MPIGDDFNVSVAGVITHPSGTATYSVLELHRWLQDMADDGTIAVAGDDVSIVSATPSQRVWDNIIKLLGTFKIDDNCAKYLYGGSITQGAGATETRYSGLKVQGSVNSVSTQLELVQDNIVLTQFWGDQTTPFNGDSATGVLMRCLVKTREFGVDIDRQKVRVQARHWGDTYDFFSVTLGDGEAVAAISTTSDAENDTAQGTVTAYTHVTNTEGYQTIDLGNGNGAQPYYSKWTFGGDTSGDGLKGMFEFIKDLTGNGTAKTIHGMNGELFLGITHSIPYDAESGAFTEDEKLVWGTNITYNSLVGGLFSAGDYVRIGANDAAGKVLYDNGSTNMIVALEDPSIALLDTDVITEASTGTVTAAINITILNNADYGGEGILLALNDEGAVGDLFIQTITGSAPVNNLPIRGLTSSATCLVDVGVIARVVPKIFLGGYTGSLIGAYGLGILGADLSATDKITDLLTATQTPPNNITWTLSGLVAGDRILVGPETGGDFNFAQLSLNTTLNGATETAVVTTTSIPADTPAAGTIRIELDTGIYRLVPYSSWTGSTYTIGSTDFTGANTATAGNNIMISYLDKVAVGTSEAFTVIYSADRSLRVRVRDGGPSPIETYEVISNLTALGGGTSAVRRPDD